MYKEIQAHIALMSNQLEHPVADAKELQAFNRVQISFFQHERLVHLLVTLFFGGAFLAVSLVTIYSAANSTAFGTVFLALALLDIVLLIPLVAYVIYYFLLENAVQRCYTFDRDLEQRIHPLLRP